MSKVNKVNKLQEEIEDMTTRINKNMDKPSSMRTVVPPVYGEATEAEGNTKRVVSKVFKDLKKSTDGITPEKPGVGKKVKTDYTEKLTLSEAWFESEDDDETFEDSFGGFNFGVEVEGSRTHEGDRFQTLSECVDYVNDMIDDAESFNISNGDDWMSDEIIVEGERDNAGDWKLTTNNRHAFGILDKLDGDGKELVIRVGAEDFFEGCNTKKVTEAKGANATKKVKTKKAEIVEGMPATVYELVYDKLFPEYTHNYGATILPDEAGYSGENWMASGFGIGDWDIGVAVKDEKDASTVRKVADFLKLKYEYKPSKMLKDGLGGVAIIRMDDDTANMPSREYLKQIGHNDYKHGYAKKKKPAGDADDEETESLSEDVTIKKEYGLSEFEPWSGAIPWFDIIREEDKLDELDRVLEEMYPDGMDETELNDLIWLEPKTVFEWIGINYDFQNDKLIDDEDDESDDEDNE